MNEHETVVRGKQQLLQLILANRNLKDLIKLAETLLDNPLILCTNNHIVWYKSKLLDDQCIAANEGESIDFASLKDLTFEKCHSQVTACPASETKLLFCPLVSKDVSQGYSFLVERKPFQPGSKELLQAFCNILSFSMEKLDHTDTLMHASAQELALINMLEDPNYLVNDKFNINLPHHDFQHLEIIVFTNEEQQKQLAPKAEVITGLKSLLPVNSCFGYSKYIIAIVPFLTYRKFKVDLNKFLQEFSMVAGVSYPFTHFTDLKTYFSQAADLASHWAGKSSRLIHYSDYFYQSIMKTPEYNLTAEGCCRSDILTLKKYDLEHNTAYLSTLRAYFEGNLNLRETAELQGIHRNSALLRMNKIRSLLDDELSLTMDCFFSILLADG